MSEITVVYLLEESVIAGEIKRGAFLSLDEAQAIAAVLHAIDHWDEPTYDKESDCEVVRGWNTTDGHPYPHTPVVIYLLPVGTLTKYYLA